MLGFWIISALVSNGYELLQQITNGQAEEGVGQHPAVHHG
jgi:hypothetical protein